jgi:hypothetical protein
LDSVLEDVTDVDLDMTLDMTSNDTNKDALLYFERLSKHYLHLVKSSPSAQQFSRHGMKFPVIADSGANYHMFRDKVFFETILPASGTVILGSTMIHLYYGGGSYLSECIIYRYGSRSI